MAALVEKELSYQLMGLLFDVHNKLGNEYQEKYYQRAVEEALKEKKISYKREIDIDLLYNDQKIGKYFLDFLIEDRIILEIKTIGSFQPQQIRQVLAYLKATNKSLGILANFRTSQLTYKRIVNAHYS